MNCIWIKTVGALAAAVAFCTGAPPAQAAFLQNTTGLVSPASTVTFDEAVFADSTGITNQFSAWGVTFSPNLFYNPMGAGAYDFVLNISGNHLANFDASGSPPYMDPFSIKFNTALTSAAFAMGTNSGTTTFTAYLGGAVVETASTTTSIDGSTYYGFTGITFDEIRVDVGANDAMVLDNIQLGAAAANAVPAPPGAVLLAVGLVMIGGFRLLRRKTAAVAIA